MPLKRVCLTLAAAMQLLTGCQTGSVPPSSVPSPVTTVVPTVSQPSPSVAAAHPASWDRAVCDAGVNLRDSSSHVHDAALASTKKDYAGMATFSELAAADAKRARSKLDQLEMWPPGADLVDAFKKSADQYIEQATLFKAVAIERSEGKTTSRETIDKILESQTRSEQFTANSVAQMRELPMSCG
jgi:hypothetical protein